MNRTLLIVTVCFGAYALLDLAVSAFVAILWRTRAVAPADLPPQARARRLLLLRLVPVMTAAAITLAVVAPAFAIFEPAGHEEEMGPVMGLLAIAAVARLSVAIVLAARSLWLTARFERAWLHESDAIDAPSGLRAYAVHSPTPIIALVGIFAPKLIAARSVIESCTPEELSRIVAHERGHLHSRDNFKRWLMASLPDALRWTPIHHEIVDAWHHAAEDAADDATTSGEAAERAELAALLLKIVRLTPQPAWTTAVVSPFVEGRGLERRVKRLLKPELEPPAPIALVPMAVATIIVAAIATTLASPG
ncbi:MAG TPA: M56 family metallopeptidase, partial [Vicinamibacterales bacterium]|nr:M56 family metallopeptidase [Vicinamibacterales bacterium]